MFRRRLHKERPWTAFNVVTSVSQSASSTTGPIMDPHGPQHGSQQAPQPMPCLCSRNFHLESRRCYTTNLARVYTPANVYLCSPWTLTVGCPIAPCKAHASDSRARSLCCTVHYVRQASFKKSLLKEQLKAITSFWSGRLVNTFSSELRLSRIMDELSDDFHRHSLRHGLSDIHE